MTLTQALEKLRAAGRLERPWLPGMMLVVNGVEVVRLAWEDSTHWHGSSGNGLYRMLRRRVLAYDLDLMDPATVGCLLALLREATGDPRIYVGFVDDNDPGWLAFIADESGDPSWALDIPAAATEGEALAAALVALAEAL